MFVTIILNYQLNLTNKKSNILVIGNEKLMLEIFNPKIMDILKVKNCENTKYR